MADITIVNGVYKPTYNWGAPSCSKPLVYQSVFNVSCIDPRNPRCKAQAAAHIGHVVDPVDFYTRRSTFQTVWRLKSIFGSHQIPNDTNIYKLDGVYTIRHVVYTISLRTLRTLGHTTYPTYTNISNLKVCPDVLNDPTTDLNWSIFGRILLLDLERPGSVKETHQVENHRSKKEMG